MLEIQIFCLNSYSFVMYIWLNDLLTKIYDHVSQYHESNYGVFSINFFLTISFSVHYQKTVCIINFLLD